MKTSASAAPQRPSNDDPAAHLVGSIAAQFAALSSVTAVALAGSRMAGPALGVAVDPGTDLDLYVYSSESVPVAARQKIARAIAGPDGPAEIDNRFWEPGDEFRDATTGLWVDVMHRAPGWIENELDRVLERHEASLGYTTCLWHNVLRSRPLFDRDGWYTRLRSGADRPYPEELRRAIVAHNLAVLHRFRSSYLHQLDAALRRADPVAVNHRFAALLASFFDVLFALNRQPHPGEKRLLRYAEAVCPRRPDDLANRVTELLTLSAAPDDGQAVLASAHGLIANLDALVAADGLLTNDQAPP